MFVAYTYDNMELLKKNKKMRENEGKLAKLDN